MDTDTLYSIIAIAHHPSYHQDDSTDCVPGRKAMAAAQLAPVIKVMTSPDLNLHALGFQVALKTDMAGTCGYEGRDGSIPVETRDWLTLARNIIREQLGAAGLLAAPDTLIMYGDTAVTLHGDPPVFDTTINAQFDGWEIL